MAVIGARGGQDSDLTFQDVQFLKGFANYFRINYSGKFYFTVRASGPIVILALSTPSMSRLFRKTIGQVFCVLLLMVCAANAEDIKKIQPSGYVSDLAGVIAADTKVRLETLARELQEKTGAQMAIVTVHSLEGQSVENYAVDLYKQLGVGSKQDSRGVLLLVAPDERKYRIEVGYGLEPVINDARAGDTGRAMVPFLRQSDYSGAVEVAAWKLAKYVADDRGVTLTGQPPARQVQQEDRPSRGIPTWVIVGIFLLLFLMRNSSGGGGGGGWWLLPFLLGGNRGRSSWGGGGWGGGGFGGSGGGGGFGGFGGGSSGGGGASGSW